MFKKLQAVLALLCMTSYAAAGTTVLGTASARGHMRVDGYTVNGDATVFDGSVVETQNASAVLRVAHGVDITMSKSSRGTLYHNRFVLQRGATEVAAPSSFALEANGLHVTAGKPDSVGIVKLMATNAVEVAAVSGSFQVRDGQGLLLSNVLPGQPLAFAMQSQVNTAQSPINIAPQSLTMVGMLSSQNGLYYLTSDANQLFQLVGKNLQKYLGYKVVVSGYFQPAVLPGGAVGSISVTAIQLNGPSKKKGAWIIIPTALAGAGAVAYVINNAVQPSASR